MRNYILDGHTPVACDDFMAWATWFESADRRVARTDLDGGVFVSTVFLGMDHQWGNGPPLLFESMVFGGPLDQEQDRYSTWDEAERGHAAMVRRASEVKP